MCRQHPVVRTVVGQVVEAPVAGRAAGAREARFVGAKDTVVPAAALAVQDVRRLRAVREAVIGTRVARAIEAVVVVAAHAAGGRQVKNVVWSAARAGSAVEGVAKNDVMVDP